jgi:hypothetical protein
MRRVCLSFDATKPMPLWLASARAFDSFAAAWETGALPKSEWTHAAHVAMAARQYALHGGDSLDRMRIGICRFNLAVGTANTKSSGYHETLTRFWMEIVARVLTNAALDNQDPWPAARVAVDELGHRRGLHTSYYSFDVVGCTEARRVWIAPDLEGPFGPIAG